VLSLLLLLLMQAPTQPVKPNPSIAALPPPLLVPLLYRQRYCRLQ
jgi:hypothetical protein